jgi:hypothetical protein
MLLLMSMPLPARASDGSVALAKGKCTLTIVGKLPLAYKRWRELLPVQFARVTWLSQFDGVTTPTRPVNVANETMIYGFACEPHDCIDNEVDLLASADGTRVVAIVHLSTSTKKPNGDWATDTAILVLGSPTPTEVSCLAMLDADKEGRLNSC